jgi:HK97 family phage major capsid protein
MNWEKILKELQEKRSALLSKIDSIETQEELNKLEMDIRKLDIKIAEAKEKAEEEQRNQGQAARTVAVNNNIDTGLENRVFNPIAGTNFTPQKRTAEENELEYRKAFMNYVLKGEEIKQETRASVTTMTTDIGAVIPNTVLNQIIENLKSYGNIFSRITITNIQGGVSIPVSSTKPTATWIAEGTVADKQKKTVTGTVTFNYYKLQCRTAVTLEASTTSLAIFESTLTDNIYEAMIIAIETAIINGTGVKQPLGIINSTTLTPAQKISIKQEELTKWDTWCDVFAKVPLTKRNGISIILNSETYEGDLLGMTDSTGQPIARTTYGLDGAESYRFKGKEVIQVVDYLPSFQAAAAGKVFGIICNLKDYMLNTNLQMTVKRYFDEDTDEYITKATTIVDGKMSDTQGVILLVKGVATI